MGKRALTPAVFLDRDGVVNDAVIRDGKPYPPAGLTDLRIATDAPLALESLHEAGFVLIVVTNQPDVARGTVSRESIENIHRFLLSQLPIDAFYACFHDDKDGCSCRKPLPGLLIEAAGERQIDLGQSFLIGDRWKDVEAGWAAGVLPVFIDRKYAERAPSMRPAATVPSLKVAADWIMKRSRCADSNAF